jgi:cation diffusion facilitator family transporter
MENIAKSFPELSPETLPEELLRAGKKVTYVGMAVNLILVVLKFLAGVAGSSSALVADAVHSASDFLTDFGVIVGLKFISKPADSTHAYGHGRVETAITLLMGLAIIATGLGLMKAGVNSVIQSFGGMFPERPGLIALVVGLVSIVSKEALFHYTRIVARKSGSTALEANAWHHRSDAFSSIGTVIGVGGAILLGDRWTVLDPAAALFVSVLVVKVGIDIGWSAFRELTDESISQKSVADISATIINVDGVFGTHKLRTRTLGRYVTVEAHVQVDPVLTVFEGHEIATDVERSIRNAHKNVAFITIHIEPYTGAGSAPDIEP